MRVVVTGLIHTAALHAPHVGLSPEGEFERTIGDCEAELARVPRFA